MEWLQENAGLAIEIGLALFIIGKWIWDKFNKAYKIKKSNEDFHTTVDNHTKQIKDMDTRHKEDYKKLNSKLDNIIELINSTQMENKEINEHLRIAMIEQMSSDITEYCEKYLERGSIEVYELTALINQFNVYTKIGGNHGAHELVDKVKHLDVKYVHKNEE